MSHFRLAAASILLLVFSAKILADPCLETKLSYAAELIEQEPGNFVFEVSGNDGVKHQLAGVSLIGYHDKMSKKAVDAFEKQKQEVERFLTSLYYAERSRVDGVLSEIIFPFKHIALLHEGLLKNCLGSLCGLVKATPHQVRQPFGSETLMIKFAEGRIIRDAALFDKITNFKQFSTVERMVNKAQRFLEKLKNRRLDAYKGLLQEFLPQLVTSGAKLAKELRAITAGGNSTNIRFRVLDLIEANFESTSPQGAQLKAEIELVKDVAELQAIVKRMADLLESKGLHQRLLSQGADGQERVFLEHSTRAVYDQVNVGAIVVNVAGSTNVRYSSMSEMQAFFDYKIPQEAQGQFTYKQKNILSVAVNEFDNIRVDVVRIKAGANLALAFREAAREIGAD